MILLDVVLKTSELLSVISGTNSKVENVNALGNVFTVIDKNRIVVNSS